MTGEAKIKGVMEFLDNLFSTSSKTKFMLFAHHMSVMDELEQYLLKKL
jgi:hypothetical protein